MSKQSRAALLKRHKSATRATIPRILKPVEIKRLTGYQPQSWRGIVPILRSGRYRVDERRVGGDAPKDFLWIYQSAKGGFHHENWPKWPSYIAKIGHQYYPAESATEQLMTRVGELCGLRIAESKLMVCAGQLRFLSRYFLRAEEILNHGADILIGYLADKSFVDGVALDRAEKVLFTFQVFCTAIRTRFKDHHDEILRDFVRMIGFDALVGNRDRHFYNWGVITHATGATPPRFAPIFDTARGLFWNSVDDGLLKYSDNKQLAKYIRGSKPQIGWDDWNPKNGELCHIDLIEHIAMSDATQGAWLEQLAISAKEAIDDIEGMIDAEFGLLLSGRRRDLIKRCLRLRFEEFAKVF